jgi:hypothetical protein
MERGHSLVSGNSLLRSVLDIGTIPALPLHLSHVSDKRSLDERS